MKQIKSNEIKAELARKNMTQNDLAKAMGISPTSLWHKMTGVTEFTLAEIRCVRDALNLNDDKLIEIFLS